MGPAGFDLMHCVKNHPITIANKIIMKPSNNQSQTQFISESKTLLVMSLIVWEIFYQNIKIYTNLRQLSIPACTHKSLCLLQKGKNFVKSDSKQHFCLFYLYNMCTYFHHIIWYAHSFWRNYLLSKTLQWLAIALQ